MAIAGENGRQLADPEVDDGLGIPNQIGAAGADIETGSKGPPLTQLRSTHQTCEEVSDRRDLRACSQGETITDIAKRWGFWHMGQFAADYKKQFGELPSETVKRVAVPG